MTKLVDGTTGNNLTYLIIGAAMAVHNRMSPGVKEEVFEANQSANESRISSLPVPFVYSGVIRGQFK